MKNRIILVVFILLAVSGIILAFQTGLFRSSVCANLSCIIFSDKGTFTLKELYTDTPRLYRALFGTKTRQFRIEALLVPYAEGQRQLAASELQFEALFEKAPAPYPGEVSDRIVCDPAFVPQKYTEDILTYFIGYMNSRTTFGACTKDQAAYEAIVAFLYCPKKSIVVRAELFSAVTDFDLHSFTDQISSIRCVP